MGEAALLLLDSEDDYWDYYVKHLVRATVVTPFGFRVHFSEHSFDHAFFTTGDYGVKGEFSFDRAKRMDEIIPALTSPDSEWHHGTNKRGRDPHHQKVCLTVDDLLIAVRISRDSTTGKVRNARFITCYRMDTINTIRKNRNSLRWDGG